jgi:hypothetical protein
MYPAPVPPYGVNGREPVPKCRQYILEIEYAKVRV